MTDSRRFPPRRRALVAAAGLAAIAAAVLGAMTAASGSERVPALPALLERPAQAQDAIPQQFTDLGGYPEITDVGAARLAGRSTTRSFYVVPGRDDQVCVVATRGAGTRFIAASSCQPRSLFDQGPLVMGLMNDDGTADVAALSLEGPVRIDQAGGRSSADADFAVLDRLDAGLGGVVVDDSAGSVSVDADSLRPATVP